MDPFLKLGNNLHSFPIDQQWETYTINNLNLVTNRNDGVILSPQQHKPLKTVHQAGKAHCASLIY